MFRSNKHIYAQIVDDAKGTTLAAASSRDADAKSDVKNGGNIAAAKAVGKDRRQARHRQRAFRRFCSIAAAIIYHGRVKALADAARRSGI